MIYIKISNEMRQVIWEAYGEVECKLRFLKGIVQNEMELSEEQLKEHEDYTNEVTGLIDGLHNDVVRNCK